jgi:hypothetical protein
LSSFSSSQTQRRQNTKENNKKKPRERKELTFKLLFYLLTFGFRFYPFVSNTFSWHLFLLEQKKKKIKKKKTIEKKINAKKGGNFPSSFQSAFSFLAPAYTFPLLPFYFKRFLLAPSFSQAEEKKRKQRK